MIRPLKASDLESIANIGFESYARRDFQFFLNHGSAYNVGLWDGRDLIGFAMGLCVRGELDIIAVAVKESVRRNGHGLRLMCEWLNDERVESASLEVREENIAAIRMYLKLGFGITGRRKKYYDGDKDALVMTLNGKLASKDFFPLETLVKSPSSLE